MPISNLDHRKCTQNKAFQGSNKIAIQMKFSIECVVVGCMPSQGYPKTRQVDFRKDFEDKGRPQ